MGLELRTLKHLYLRQRRGSYGSMSRINPVTKKRKTPSSALLKSVRSCSSVEETNHLSNLHNHQSSRAWAPGMAHVQAISSSRLSINPFSLAAKNVSSRTVTVSSSCPANADSDGGTATKIRPSFAAVGGGEAVSFGQ